LKYYRDTVVPEPPHLIRRAIVRLRVIAFLEGVSYLLLLGIAMPLKYLAGLPQAVSVTGLVHGLLFMAFLAALAQVALILGWSRRRVVEGLAASVIPFGTFVLDRRLQDEQRRVPHGYV
jgi:integral membrane protein